MAKRNKEKYDIPFEVVERERLRVKQLRDNKTKGRLSNGAAQFVHDGITYTLSPNKLSRHGLEVKVASKEAAKEARRRGIRNGQSIDATPEQKQRHQQLFADRDFLSRETGQRYEVDHIQPINKGGKSNDPDNEQLILGSINGAAGDVTEGPLYDLKMQNGLETQALLHRLKALQFDQYQQLEAIAQLQGALPGELQEANRETTARMDKMSEIARKNGGVNGTPDFGISEMLFGKSLVNDERQDFAR